LKSMRDVVKYERAVVGSAARSHHNDLLLERHVMASNHPKPVPELTQRQIKRFWSRVKKSNGCWMWKSPGKRYGTFMFGGKSYRAHRVAYRIAKGRIPDGLLVCHTCDTPKCCRPRHLFAGTQSENINDMYDKGRDAARSHQEKYPHGEDKPSAKLTEEAAKEIRESGLSHRKLGRLYGVSHTTIGTIKRRTKWKHVP